MFYALGDIHGQMAQLDRALALIDADGGGDADLFFVGDLVDAFVSVVVLRPEMFHLQSCSPFLSLY